MGTDLYKGNTTHYHSIGQNVMVTAKSYPMRNGYFGVNSPSTRSRTRNIYSPDNLATAKDFYSKIANGGKETIYNYWHFYWIIKKLMDMRNIFYTLHCLYLVLDSSTKIFISKILLLL